MTPLWTLCLFFIAVSGLPLQGDEGGDDCEVTWVTVRADANAEPKFHPEGRCGREFGGLTCDPKGNFGGCCSDWGYCGSTTTHCSVADKCQSGCTEGDKKTDNKPETSSNPGQLLAVDGKCGKDHGGAVCDPKAQNGPCCSAWGQCGSTSQHCSAADKCQSGCTEGDKKTTEGDKKTTEGDSKPTNGNPSGFGFDKLTASGTPPLLAVDGKCGKDHGGAVCDPRADNGPCCSGPWGQCGSTPTHCLVEMGCQSGCTGGGANTTSVARLAKRASLFL